MIEEIKELGPEFETSAFGDGSSLEDREIEVVDAIREFKPCSGASPARGNEQHAGGFECEGRGTSTALKWRPRSITVA